MNQWAIDKTKKAMDLLVESNNERLTCNLFTDEENKTLTQLYGDISKIILDATKRHIKGE